MPKASFLIVFVVALGLVPAHLSAQDCAALDKWFETNREEPDFGPPHENGGNCGFHKWAWDTFLWLVMKDAKNDRLRFLNFPTNHDLFQPGKAPESLGDSLVNRISSRKLTLSPRVNKGFTPSNEEIPPVPRPEGVGADDESLSINQAVSNGILVDKNGKPIYYAIHVNETFFNFVRDNKLFTLSGYNAFDSEKNFPVKSLELKSAWMVVSEDDDASAFFTTTALVNPLKCRDGSAECSGRDIQIDTTKFVEETVALVGIHVVGVTEQHPEFLWATFEHVNNAPDLPDGMARNSEAAVSSQDFTFYSKNTPAKNCNQLFGDFAVTLDVAKQKLSPSSQIFRDKRLGGGDPNNVTDVAQLNQSVHQKLEEVDSKSVWLNYRLSGNVWFAPGQVFEPGLSRRDMLARDIGSTEVSNTTMETYTQVISGRPKRENCFACHTTDRKRQPLPSGNVVTLEPKNINVSHIVRENLIEREFFKSLAVAPRPAAEAAGDTVKKINTYDDLKKLMNDFLDDNGIFIGSHGRFWNDLTYEQFVSGNVPDVEDPDTGDPLPILVKNKSKESNFVLALKGEGPLFNDETGTIGRMPISGPFMHKDQISVIADWIDRGCPNSK